MNYSNTGRLVYRGIGKEYLQTKFLERAFSSTTTDIKIAKRFALKGCPSRSHCYILMITIPNTVASYKYTSILDDESEIILQRNIMYEFIGLPFLQDGFMVQHCMISPNDKYIDKPTPYFLDFHPYKTTPLLANLETIKYNNLLSTLLDSTETKKLTRPIYFLNGLPMELIGLGKKRKSKKSKKRTHRLKKSHRTKK
jgi:hypothetical protein